jgi:hypothetical protein
MLRPRLVLLLAAVLLLPGGLVAPAQAAARPSCGTTWGSQPRSSDRSRVSGDFVENVRAGRHACYDRLVIYVGEAGGLDSYDVRYVPVVTAEGSGDVVPLRGRAALQVVVRAPAYDQYGQATYSPANPSELARVGGYRTFRQVAWAGSFEGQTTLGLGVRARLPFRVFMLFGPPGVGPDMRVVVDVAHRW